MTKTKTVYNRKQHRWERAAPCGRIVRSAKRIGLYGRMYHHLISCWRCRFLDLCEHDGSKRRPDPETLAQFGHYISTTGFSGFTWTRGDWNKGPKD